VRRSAPSSSPGMVPPGSGRADTATVVIGIDDSDAAWAAFCWACREARRVRARAVAAFIGPPLGSTIAALAAAADLVAVSYRVMDFAVSDHAAGLLAAMRNEAAGLDLAFIHAPGDPVAGLLRIAEEVHADLIVVGRPAGVLHRLTGSVGKRLAARRRGPVIVVVPEQ
jgi:nucleotide-binding universal stress UspA family protein